MDWVSHSDFKSECPRDEERGKPEEQRAALANSQQGSLGPATRGTGFGPQPKGSPEPPDKGPSWPTP